MELRGFGTFSPKVRSPYVERNPKPGTEVSLPKRTAPYFKAGKEMRDRLNPTCEQTPNEAAGH
jgi:integration host factor subunit beta